MATRSTTRLQNYHGGAKGHIVGNSTGRPAPAWRPGNIPSASGHGPNGLRAGHGGAAGQSKILLSNLPPDVSEEEIVDLMRKTIGPVSVHESCMFYNVKGFPLGMAIVAFIKAADAVRAREKYNGKVIDGKRAIKLELVTDRDDVRRQNPLPRQPAAPKVKSLFDRLGPAPAPKQTSAPPARPANPAGTRPPPTIPYSKQQAPIHPTTPAKRRQKKGPRRVKKSVADLDREMEEYAASRAGDAFDVSMRAATG